MAFKKDIRSKFLSNKKILISGNPINVRTLASGFVKIYPDATFISKSNGWDLNDFSDQNVSKLLNLFKNFNTFINASYIGPFVQEKLLDLYNSTQKYADVFNFGSTHEYDGMGSVEYSKSKIALRNKSLELNNYRFRTHHIILGGIKNPFDPATLNFLEIDTICQIVPWILEQNFNVPIMCMDQQKESW
jgi:hypothetical protein